MNSLSPRGIIEERIKNGTEMRIRIISGIVNKCLNQSIVQKEWKICFMSIILIIGER